MRTEYELTKALIRMKRRSRKAERRKSEADDYRCAIEALEEIRQYQALGTIQELRLARSKQIPEKVRINAYDNTKECPRCQSVHVIDADGCIQGYCPECGQKIRLE